MNKEEFLKIQTCVLKVNIHCEGCKNKVKKILQRIEGVYTIKIDSESGKVTVSGNVDPATLIKKLIKKGKHAELCGGQKASNNNQNHQLNNQFKNLQIENVKGGKGEKGQGEKGMKGGNPGGMPMPTPQQLQQLQQQMKGFQDMKMPPQFKDLKFPMNGGGGGNPKTVKFDLPEEDDDFSDDDEFDDDDDEYDDEDDDFDDEMDDMPPPAKAKPMMGNGGGGGGGGQMQNIMHLMNGKKDGIMPHMSMGGGGNKGGVNQIQGGGSPKKGGKNGGGGGHPQDGKNFGSNGGSNKNGGGGHGAYGGAGGGPNFNGGNKGGVMNNNGLPSMPNMMAMKANVPNMGPMPTGPMGHHVGQIPAVQGLPAPGMTSVRSSGGYFPAAGTEVMAGNPYQQQQMAAMMMNQQHGNGGNERFQPMMYAPQPPAVNYLPPPYPYYPYPPPNDNYGSTMFSDENPSACKVM